MRKNRVDFVWVFHQRIKVDNTSNCSSLISIKKSHISIREINNLTDLIHAIKLQS